MATVLGGALLSEGSEALVGSGEAIAAGALLAARLPSKADLRRRYRE